MVYLTVAGGLYEVVAAQYTAEGDQPCADAAGRCAVCSAGGADAGTSTGEGRAGRRTQADLILSALLAYYGRLD